MTALRGVLTLKGGRIEAYHGLRQGDAPVASPFRMGYTITLDGWSSHDRFGQRWEHNRWIAHYRHQGRMAQVTYSTGMGIDKPEPWGPLAAMFSDARAADDAASWEEFARNFGIEDADRARRTFNACVQQGERLERLIPDDERRQAWADALELKESGL